MIACISKMTYIKAATYIEGQNTIQEATIHIHISFMKAMTYIEALADIRFTLKFIKAEVMWAT
jgi:hypothetical protein